MSDLKQCPYSKATECAMLDSCLGCETLAIAWSDKDARIERLEEALAAVRKLINYPWSVFEAPVAAIDIVDKALNKSGE